MNAGIKVLSESFEKLAAGRNLEGRAKQLAFNITRQLENARRRIARGKPVEAIPRKFIVQDIDELSALLARGDAGVSP